MDRKKQVGELHDKGYNCAQSVLCTFKDKVDIDEKTLFRMAEGFGRGMGHKGVCGAVSAMTMLAGIIVSDGNLECPKTKLKTYELSEKMIGEFKEKVGSICCYEILGEEAGVPLRSCLGCMEDCCEIAERNLF